MTIKWHNIKDKWPGDSGKLYLLKVAYSSLVTSPNIYNEIIVTGRLYVSALNEERRKLKGIPHKLFVINIIPRQIVEITLTNNPNETCMEWLSLPPGTAKTSMECKMAEKAISKTYHVTHWAKL